MELDEGDLSGLSPGIASKADGDSVVMQAFQSIAERNRWLLWCHLRLVGNASWLTAESVRYLGIDVRLANHVCPSSLIRLALRQRVIQLVARGGVTAYVRVFTRFKNATT